MSESSPIAPALLAWHAAHGRHDLPWQGERTPYRVWVSEIMLQQTQVATVIPYYQRFLARFPDVRALADAAVDEVLHLWSGLGYYARARNLHRAAVRVRDEYAGELPRDFASLAALPGIGRSTAGAILALAFGERFPILDGNARRVLARYFAVATPPGAATTRRLWELAEDATPDAQIADYTQAIMDLGATVCVRQRPLCPTCPLSERCAARRRNRQQELPARRARAARARRSVYMVVALADTGEVLARASPGERRVGRTVVPAGVRHRERGRSVRARRDRRSAARRDARAHRARLYALRPHDHAAPRALRAGQLGYGGPGGALV